MACARCQRAGAGEADREGRPSRPRGPPVDSGAECGTDHRQRNFGEGTRRQGVPFRPRLCGLGRHHRTRPWHRRQASPRPHLQTDRMLRTLLINGASAYLRQQKRRGISDPWLRELLARRPYKVAMGAFAAKTARIIWAMLAKKEVYRDRTSASAAA